MKSPFPDKVEAVVLAGGDLEKLEWEAPKPLSKGFLPIQGVPMAALTMRGLTGSQRVNRIILVSPPLAGPLEGPYWKGVDHVAPAGVKMIESFCNGVEAARNPHDPVLICCGDMVLLSPEAVDDFVRRCSTRAEASIWYGYLRKELSLADFPDTPHTYAKLADGTFCGIGMMMLRPEVVAPVKAAMDSLTQARKNMPLLASRLGFGTVLSYLLGRLTVAKAEKAGLRILGVPCAGIECTYPEAGFNVDDNVGLAQARRYVAAQLKEVQ